MFFINKQDTSKDKYDMAKFAEYQTDIYDTLNSHMWASITKLASAGEFRVSDTAGRPDLISYRIYSTTALWWIILTYNGLIRPSDLVEGTLLKYPSLQDIETLRLTLPALQGAS